MLRQLSTFALILTFLCVVTMQCMAADKPHAHDHAAKGPHGGTVMPMGDEEFHTEMVLDEKQNVITIYLLDKDAVSGVSIESPFVLVNIKVAGQPRQYKLPAVSMAADVEGTSSRFALQNADLIKALHQHDSGAVLRVGIGTKSYAAKLVLAAHDHKH